MSVNHNCGLSEMEAPVSCGVQINECYIEKLAGCSSRTTTQRRRLRLLPVTHSLCLKTQCKLNTFGFACVSPLSGKISMSHIEMFSGLGSSF